MSGSTAKAGARPAAVSLAAHFPLTSLDVVVLEVEGKVQLVYLAQGWDGGPMKALSNQFAGPDTAAQLRAIAQHMDGINWSDLGMAEVA